MNPNVYSRFLSFRAFVIAVTVSSILPLQTAATPYASGLTNTGTSISFRLNESADNVKVISNGGATTNDLGPLPAGVTTASLSIIGVYQIQVAKAGDCTIRTNSAPVAFNSPRGVAVNRNPASPYFGRVYVANSADGTKGDGIFVFNSDLSDTFGQGATALTAGLDFATGGTVSPYRLAVGDDDLLYIADWSDLTPNLYLTDPDVTISGFALASDNHVSVAAVAPAGSTNSSDLTIYTVDEDLSTSPPDMNSLWEYPVGSGPLPTSVVPNKLMTPVVNTVSQTMDLARGPNGYLYVSQYRSAGSEPAVYVVDPIVGVLTNTLRLSQAIGSSTDVLRATGGVTVSPDGKYLAVVNIENNVVTVVPLTNGIPDLSGRVQFTGFGTTPSGRGIAFDAANNLYVISSGLAILQSLTLGLKSTATTGSDGTFNLDVPHVSVRATDLSANETGPDTGTFTITREGNTSEPLTVGLTIIGVATNGVDYTTIPTSVTFAPGQSVTNITISPNNDTAPEANETVIITIACAPSFSVLFYPTATVTIIDNDQPLVTIAAVHSNMYERVTTDYVSFSVTRGGDIANSSLTVNLAYSGTASDGVDYPSGPTSVFMDVGQGTVSITNNPTDDSLLEGNETIVVSIVPDAAYIVGSPGSAPLTIVDDELGLETVLFSDNFETDTSANWIKQSGAANGVADDVVNFNYDYSSKGIPAAPGGSTTLGLRVSANKQDTVLSAAGVNLYPSGVSVSNDFALRFQMFIEGISGAGTTEHILFGINHSGTKTNWAFRATTGTGFNAATPGNGDGIWFNVVEDASGFPGGNDYGAFTSVTAPPTIRASRTAASLTQTFKAPPYRFSGSPASFTPTPRQEWVDVEVRQVGGVITHLINNTPILLFTNTTGFASGNIMIGYNDAFGSIGGGNANTIEVGGDILSGFVIYDNVRVVSLALRITSIKILAGHVQIEFTDDSMSGGPYALRKSSAVTGPYAPDVASLTALGGGMYRFTTTQSGPIQFYQVSR